MNLDYLKMNLKNILNFFTGKTLYIYLGIGIGLIGLGAYLYNFGYNKAETYWKREIDIANAQHQIRVDTLEKSSKEMLSQLQREIENEQVTTKEIITATNNSLNGLQQQIQYYKDKASRASISSKAFDAKIALSWELFEECTVELTELGKQADRQRNALKEWQGYGTVIEQYNTLVKD